MLQKRCKDNEGKIEVLKCKIKKKKKKKNQRKTFHCTSLRTDKKKKIKSLMQVNVESTLIRKLLFFTKLHHAQVER